ncbi:MAG: prepilin peptidase [Alphaproteobacteria bacterium]
MNHFLALFFALAFVFCVTYAMISDFTRLHIPNAVPIVLAGVFLLFALAGGVRNIWPHLALAGAVFVLLFAFFAVGWVGAGDVKFATAITLWTGPVTASTFVTLFAIFGAVLAVGLIVLRHALRRHPGLGEMLVLAKVSRWARNGICPYGLPIGLAALCVAPMIFASPFRV